MIKPKDVPIPERMKHLGRDSRGLPVPYVVLVDAQGKAHFTVNDTAAVYRCLTENLCHVCGGKIGLTGWFVGGPLSAFHEHGLYIDGPVHHECMTYAMQVCPYLAAPHYQAKMDPLDRHEKNEALKGMTLVDYTMMPDRPVLFVAVCADGEDIVPNGPGHVHRPHRPYLNVEYWQAGNRLADDVAKGLVAEVLAANAQPVKGITTRKIK